MNYSFMYLELSFSYLLTFSIMTVQCVATLYVGMQDRDRLMQRYENNILICKKQTKFTGVTL